MPSSTPNRGYPFPLDADPIDIARDVERLARAVDNDNAGIVSTLTAADLFYAVSTWITGVGAQQNRLLIQGNSDLYTTSGFGTFIVSLPFAYPSRLYVAMASTASPDPYFVHAMDRSQQHPNTFTCLARRTDTGAALGPGLVVGIWWLTIGLQV